MSFFRKLFNRSKTRRRRAPAARRLKSRHCPEPERRRLMP